MLDEIVNEAFEQAKKARASLCKKPGIVAGTVFEASPGLYLRNYSQCLLNRQLDIFDDATLLLDNDRIPSACIVSRVMSETYAFAKFLGNTLVKILDKTHGQKSVDDCTNTILRFTNSSRLKETEQKKMFNGIFGLDDYQFTEQAKDRMRLSLAESEHVMNALRSLFKEEIEHTGGNESQLELVYDSLSEWVHPSQTSIFHNYVPDTHLVPTSHGETHLYDVARLQCVRALHFITDSETVHTWLLGLADDIDLRSKRT